MRTRKRRQANEKEEDPREEEPTTYYSHVMSASNSSNKTNRMKTTSAAAATTILLLSLAQSILVQTTTASNNRPTSGIKFSPDTNAYSGLTFSFDPRLDKRVEWLHFEHWLSIMHQSSELLHESLNGRAHLGEVRVLIPYRWRNVQWPVLNKPGAPIIMNRKLRYTDSDVIVGFDGKFISSLSNLFSMRQQQWSVSFSLVALWNSISDGIVRRLQRGFLAQFLALEDDNIGRHHYCCAAE